MAPKKKMQKMGLTEFFADAATGGSWADDDLDLPSAPAAKDPSAPKRGEPGYLDSMPDRSARSFPGGPPSREELPLPTQPPFTAFVGNLTFETDESDLRTFFSSLEPISTRLVKADGKSKGFGYVEFSSQDKLKDALDKSGSQLGGRTVRISVADAPSTSRKEYLPSAAEESSQWRRAGPLPTRDPAPLPSSSARRGPSFTSSPSIDQGERDWGAARGAKFTPSSTTSPTIPSRETSGYGFNRENSGGGFQRGGSGAGRLREQEDGMGSPSAADEASVWRSNKPIIDPKVGQGLKEQMGSSGQSSPGLADTESTWSRGTKLRTPASEAPTRETTASPDERDWGKARQAAPTGSRRGSADASSQATPPAPAPAAPVERRRLQLAPRSTSSTAVSPIASPSRSSIFGGAAPIDTAAKEAAAADKIKQMDKERREAATKAKEEEERKVREHAEERDRQFKEQQRKAFEELGLEVPGDSAAASTNGPSGGAASGGGGGGGGGRGGHGERGGRGRGGPPGRGGSGGGRGGQGGGFRNHSGGGPGAASRPAVHSRDSTGSTSGNTTNIQTPKSPNPNYTPSSNNRKSSYSNTPKIDEDGFEIAQGPQSKKNYPSANNNNKNSDAPKVILKNENRANGTAPKGNSNSKSGGNTGNKGFSFAAAGIEGFGDDEDQEEEEEETVNGEEEEEVRKGVEEVTI